MDKLHNCPNCGGYLNDRGRCEFCGSKVYDFCDIDISFDPTKSPVPTYLRMKTQQGIWTVPVIANTLAVTHKADCYTEGTEIIGNNIYPTIFPVFPEIELQFLAVGEGTYEE